MTHTNEDLILLLQTYYTNTGKIPTVRLSADTLGASTSIIRQRFGTWSAALSQAHIPLSRDRNRVITTCTTCRAPLTTPRSAVRRHNFCSSSCAATHNNSKRRVRPETRLKISNTLSITKRPKMCRVYQLTCNVCFTSFLHKNRNKQTCGDGCYKRLMSIRRTKFLKDYAGTFNWIPNGKPNYFEQSFISWLGKYGFAEGVDFISLSQSFHNHEHNTTYFLDIYFPALKLNIELDGTHHERPFYVNRDSIRDEYLLRVLNITTHRISIRAYNKKNGRQRVFDDVLSVIKHKQTLTG